MLETPYIVINTNQMERNIQRMAQKARKLNVQLRPHCKTHKMPHIAKMQLEAGSAGITVAKVSEAEVMAEHGINDIFIAYPIVIRSKIERVLHLYHKGAAVIIGADSLEGARVVSETAAAFGQIVKVRLEIDTGLGRTGVIPTTAVSLAREISALPNVELTGIFTFRSNMLQGKSTLDLQAAGNEEGQMMVALAEEMRAAGLAIRDVSVGSTPTGLYAAEVAGVTEIRPGTYVFNDQMQVQMGCCAEEDCAAMVCASIISVPSPQSAVIDAGSKTFATDVQPNGAPLYLQGFGRILGHPDVVLERLNEEHGMLKINGSHNFKIGDVIKVVPNHICSTVNLHNSVYFFDGKSYQERVVLGRGKLT